MITDKHPDYPAASAELPRYRSHKEVWALKIDTLKARVPDDGTLIMTPSDTRYAAFILDADYVSKHKPEAGGYYVVYKDGSQSFSPSQAFEEGYTLI